MNSPLKQGGNRLTVRDICILAVTGALIFSTKLVLAGIPNVNLNTTIIILISIFFGWRALYAVAVYVMMEGLVFGFTLWWFSYLYTWPVIVAVVMLFRNNRSPVFWAVVAGIYGLCFGPLMYLLYFTVNGWHMVFAMWAAGIPYDITFCVSNFILTLILFKPLYRVMEQFLTGTDKQAGP